MCNICDNGLTSDMYTEGTKAHNYKIWHVYMKNCGL